MTPFVPVGIAKLPSGRRQCTVPASLTTEVVSVVMATAAVAARSAAAGVVRVAMAEGARRTAFSLPTTTRPGGSIWTLSAPSGAAATPATVSVGRRLLETSPTPPPPPPPPPTPGITPISAATGAAPGVGRTAGRAGAPPLKAATAEGAIPP